MPHEATSSAPSPLSTHRPQLPPAEVLELLRACPPDGGAAAALRRAFLELAPLRRGELLGARTSFEGLRKATREPGGAVYEATLQL